MYSIGIDVGGTKIQGSVVDDKGRIVLSERVLTQADKGKRQVIKNIVEVVTHLRINAHKRIIGVGISMPGFLHTNGRVAFGGGTLSCLTGVNLKKELSKHIKIPIHVENDARCFALAEALFGLGKRNKVVLGVIWGTGIGSGIVINKKIYDGEIGGSGEFGHMLIDPERKTGHVCGCGRRGCLEMIASGKSITQRYYDATKKVKTATAIYAAGDKLGKQIMDESITAMGQALAAMVNILNPGIIIIGGGVSNLPDSAYKRIEAEIKRCALPILTEGLKIKRYSLSDAAGVIGAAQLCF